MIIHKAQLITLYNQYNWLPGIIQFRLSGSPAEFSRCRSEGGARRILSLFDRQPSGETAFQTETCGRGRKQV